VIVSGPAGAPATRALLSAAHGATWPPDRAVIALDPASPADAAAWRALNPRALEMAAAHAARQRELGSGGAGGGGGGGGATAFVCQDYTCREPTGDAGRLAALLREGAVAGGGGRVTPFAWPPAGGAPPP
jgi:uncharacterized protein YyaL (SSP411 family)